MEKLLNFISNKNKDFNNAVKDIYKKDFYIFSYLNLCMVKVEYKYTNGKSLNRKIGIKYFIGSYSIQQVNKEFHSIFKKWVDENNLKKKHKLLNVKVSSIKLINSISLFGDSKAKSLYSKHDIESLALIEDNNFKNILSLFKNLESNNIRDYVIQSQISINTYIANVKYKTLSNNIKYKHKVFIQITDESSPSTQLFSSSYPEGMARRSIDILNSKEPYRRIDFIDWEIKKQYSNII